MRHTSFVVNKTAGKLPAVDFALLKKQVLGEKYDLSVALLTPAASRKVTLQTKGKDKASNVLSFPLTKRSGEVLLCPTLARSQAKDYEASAGDFLAYLFIHGMLHLKGLAHGATMENTERRILKKFALRVTV